MTANTFKGTFVEKKVLKFVEMCAHTIHHQYIITRCVSAALYDLPLYNYTRIILYKSCLLSTWLASFFIWQWVYWHLLPLLYLTAVWEEARFDLDSPSHHCVTVQASTYRPYFICSDKMNGTHVACAKSNQSPKETKSRALIWSCSSSLSHHFSMHSS